MGATPLVETDIAMGRSALNAISSDAKVRVRAALWMFDDNRHEWIFTLSTAFYEKRGAQAAYLKFRQLFRAHAVNLTLDRVSVISDHHPVLTVLRKKFLKSSDIFIISQSIDGVLVPDLYLYLIEKRMAGAHKRHK